ncbi:porin [Glaciimonas sp. PCH181]|uniref:porin n=1 Tax=Glaciimonas sp. PCH181 TaxID=2133943 RepID=UPI000D34B79D|nr:porin [Glaciimonas sp. PCH181]PUA19479.1 porin [Glaciimonas sp. PCH181]
MKKTLIALGLISTTYGSFAIAQSNVTIFGIADLGVSSAKKNGADSSTVGLQPGGLQTSALGFKGSEELGGGMKVNFELSSFLNLATGTYIGGQTAANPSGTLFMRSSWVNISGDYGAVSLGRDVSPTYIPTILFNAFGPAVSYSPLWHATYFDFVLNGTKGPFGAGAGNGLVGDTSWNNQVRYTSPKFGGVQVNLNYAFGGVAGKSNQANYGGNLMYSNGPLGLAAYWQQTKLGEPGAGNPNAVTASTPATTYFLGGSYDFGIIKAFATYQDAKQTSTGTDAKTYQVSTSIPAGNGKFLLEYANTKYAVAAKSTTIAQLAIGYDYNLSKRSEIYINSLYGTQSNLSSGYAVGVGIRHFF